MIDVLYIIGKGSLYDDDELRYSLRSLDKYGKNIKDVLIVGECPDFVDKGEVIWIPCDDLPTPSLSHWWKVRQAFGLTDRVMLMYDDIFFCKEFDCDTYPWFWRGDLTNVPHNCGYPRSLYLSYKFLSKLGHTTLDFEEHIPCIYEKEKFMSLDDYFYKYSNDEGLSVRSVYANVWVKGSEYKPDVKLFKKKNLTVMEVFSTGDKTYGDFAQSWLHEKFKEKSRWER